MLLPLPSTFDYCFIDTEHRRYIRARVLKRLYAQKLERKAKNPLWKLGAKLSSTCPSAQDQALMWLGVVALALLVGGLLVGALIQELFPAFGGWVLCLMIVLALLSPFFVAKMALSLYRSTQCPPTESLKASKTNFERTVLPLETHVETLPPPADLPLVAVSVT